MEKKNSAQLVACVHYYMPKTDREEERERENGGRDKGVEGEQDWFLLGEQIGQAARCSSRGLGYDLRTEASPTTLKGSNYPS